MAFLEFQFHNGSIKRRLEWAGEVCEDVKFQFHNGSIKSDRGYIRGI